MSENSKQSQFPEPLQSALLSNSSKPEDIQLREAADHCIYKLEIALA